MVWDYHVILCKKVTKKNTNEKYLVILLMFLDQQFPFQQKFMILIQLWGFETLLKNISIKPYLTLNYLLTIE